MTYVQLRVHPSSHLVFLSLAFLALPSARLFMTLVSGGAAGATATALASRRQLRRNRRRVVVDRPLLRPAHASREPIESPRAADPARSVRRPHLGRQLPLARAATIFTMGDDAALDDALAFSDQLSTLPLEAWMHVGGEMAGRALAAEYLAAQAALNACIADQRLCVVAWNVRDAVETAAFHATCRRPLLSRVDRRLIAAAHDAAEYAALALLVKASLSPCDHTTLIAPFAGCIPLGDSAAAP